MSKRVMHILNSLHFGGMEKSVVSLVNSLDRSKYLPIVCSLSSSYRDLENELLQKGIKIIYLNRRENGFDFLLPFKLARVLKKEKVQIAHTHNFAGFLYGTIGTLLSKTPAHLHTQQGTAFINKRMRAFIARIFTKKIDNFVVVSKPIAQELMHFVKVKPQKIFYIPNSVPDARCNVNKHNHIKRSQLGFHNSDILIGSVGRLHPVKNYDVLLKSMPYVLKQYPQTKLVIVGDGEEKQNLLRIAMDLKIRSHVLFLGKRDDVNELLSLFYLFVLPSKYEGTSLSLIEAMASSLPVVATRVGGNPELVKDENNGVLVEPSDPKKLAEAILKILGDKALAKRLGTNGRMIYERNYTINSMVMKYEQVYQTCLC